MKRLPCLLLLCAACEPSLYETVRPTLARQVPPAPAANLDARAEAARQSLSRWQSADAEPLFVALRDARDELALSYAVADPHDLPLTRAVELFLRASDGLAAAKAPPEPAAQAQLLALLSEARQSATAARANEPTAVSPAATLRALRKHQGADEHFLK